MNVYLGLVAGAMLSAGFILVGEVPPAAFLIVIGLLLGGAAFGMDKYK